MIGEKILKVICYAGSTAGDYLSNGGISKSGQFVNNAFGQVFTNPGKLYTDLRTGTLDAVNNKLAETVVTVGIILLPVLIAARFAIKGRNSMHEAVQMENNYKPYSGTYMGAAYTSKQIKENNENVGALVRTAYVRYVAAACSLVVAAALLYITASELRQNGSIISNQLAK